MSDNAHPQKPSILLIAGGCAMVAAVLVVPLPKSFASATGMALHDALHFPLFAALTIWLCGCLRVIPRGIPFAIAIGVGIAVASELAQERFGRVASWRDLRFDLVGIAAGAFTAITLFNHSSPLTRRCLLIASIWVTGTAIVMRPALIASTADKRHIERMPVLGDFEEEWEMLQWRPQGNDGRPPVRVTRVKSHASTGSYALQLDSQGSSWAGVHLLLPDGVSWADYNSLGMEIFNPGDAFELGVRVDVEDKLRFSGSIEIKPGVNSCTLAFSELRGNGLALTEGDVLANVKRLVLHLGGPPATLRFFIDNVRLDSTSHNPAKQ